MTRKLTAGRRRESRHYANDYRRNDGGRSQQRSVGVLSHTSRSTVFPTVTALRVLTVAIVYMIAAAVGIFGYDGRLIPDTQLYAESDRIARRSSPFMATVGLLFGYLGVQITALVFAGILGAVMTHYVNTRWAIALAVLPCGWAIGLAGADSMGTVGAVLAMVNPWFLPLAGVFHVQAALVAGLCFWYRASGGSFRYVPLLALSGSLICCLYQWHLQTRYFMPGVAIAAWAIVQRRQMQHIERVTL